MIVEIESKRDKNKVIRKKAELYMEEVGKESEEGEKRRKREGKEVV